MDTNHDSKIRVLVDKFVLDVQSVLFDRVKAALGGGTPPAATPSTPSRKVARRVTKAASAAKTLVKGKRKERAPGEKRAPEALNALVEKLHQYITANPGQRMEAIGKGLKISTRELNLPIKKLLGAKRVKATGHKRATEYTAV